MTMDDDYTAGLPADMQEWVADLETDDQREIARAWEISALAARAPDDAATEDELTAMMDRIDRQDSTGSAVRSDAGRAHPDSAASVDRRAKKPSRDEQERTWLRRTSRRTAVGSVSAAVVIALLGLVWLLVPVTETAPRGEGAVAFLPDGSRVELSSGSTISYRSGFIGWDRRVTLDGEAFFDVVSDTKPFIVETFNAEVNVLGTRFNVRAFEQAHRPATRVVVEEGSVQFQSSGSAAEAVRLEARDFSQLSAESEAPTAPVETDIRRRMAWRFGEVAFQNEALADVLSEIERRYNVTIRLESNGIRDRRITLFRGEDATARDIVKDLCGYFSLDCDLSGPAWILRRSNENP